MDDLGVFLEAAEALDAGQPVALITVIATAGSTPGKVGYQMLVPSQGGRTVGTVGGGLIEARMVEAARGLLAEPSSQIHRVALGETPDDEKGICGGSVEFLIETFDRAALPLFKELLTDAAADRRRWLVSILSPAHPPQKVLLGEGGRIEGWTGAALPLPLAARLWEAAAAEPCASRLSCEGVEVFVQGVACPPPLIVFGAGHLSVFIARFAQSVHFRVTVVDDRPEYASRERFPDVHAVLVEDFTRILERIEMDGRSYVVIVTRGHRWDETVLEQVLKTDARYIGMIGSRRKTLTLLERLSQKGVPEERLKRVYSPIGLSIGAVTPEEIALSIASELVKIRRLGDGPGIGHMTLSHLARSAGVNP
jgi:xanthine dehydrogenase accessory factor